MSNQSSSKVSEDPSDVSIESIISTEDDTSQTLTEGQLINRKAKSSVVNLELKDRIEDLEVKLKTILSDFEKLKERHEASDLNIKRLDSRLSKFERTDQSVMLFKDEFSLRLGAIEEKLSNLSKVRKKTQKPRLPVRRDINFKLLSIDQWGDVKNAVIDNKGDIDTVSEGDTISEWRVQSIGNEGCLVVQNETTQSNKTICQSSRFGNKQ
jgi:hypothetical protein